MNVPSLLAPAPPCCQDETWEPLPGWPHEVSSCGRVRSTDRADADGVLRLGAMLPQHPDKRPGKGYLYADLRDGRRRRRAPVAVIVLEAHDKPRPGPQYEACHGNDVRTDNHRRNLAWDTRAANLARMWERRRRRGAVTDTLPDPSREALDCHKPLVSDPGRRPAASVTGDGPQGTGSPPASSRFPSVLLPVQPFTRAARRTIRALRNRTASRCSS